LRAPLPGRSDHPGRRRVVRSVCALTERPRNNRFSGPNGCTGFGGNAPISRRLRRRQLRKLG
jgi:hypothetical protein